MSIARSVISAALALSLSGATASSQTQASRGNWPGWRGALRDGISTETGLLTSWPQGGPPKIWTATGLGQGYASVSVVGGRIFTTGDRPDGQYALAVDEASGKLLWATKLGSANSAEGERGGSRSTPSVEGDLLWLTDSDGNVFCLETATGKERWRRSMTREFGGSMMTIWGYAESPLLDGDRVVVTPGGPKAAMVTLDKLTGKEIWRAATPSLGQNGRDGAGYSSIVISNGGGVKQYVQLIGSGVIGVRAEDGKFLWNYNRVANGTANIPTPIVTGDYVFTSTGYQTGAALLKLSPDGDGVRAEEIYFLDAGTFQNHHGQMILVDGYVYAGHQHNKGLPICIELATGKVMWGGRIQGAGSGSAAIT
ncbi:MAG TPA: PQQ-binding-like beta-propeller repeat protein, partial [Vicinamibacterales bacterium]|nr:PQQ-binding-like beta-propeller repeat protein [Vicinamibacterales bacterium]